MTGISLKCPTCGYSRNLTYATSGMSRDEAMDRLRRWAHDCPGPGQKDDHKMLGAVPLLGNYATAASSSGGS